MSGIINPKDLLGIKDHNESRCKHPKLQNRRKDISATYKCSDCKQLVFYLSDNSRERISNMFKKRKE